MKPSTSRPLAVSLALMIVTIAAGLTVRFAHLGLPPFIVKYGGSILWALMIYWVISTLLPSSHLLVLAVISGLLATAVEFLKLYRSPGLDAFRHTLPGIILLGRFFSFWDVLAYWIAIAFGALIDRAIRQPQKKPLPAA